MLWLGFLINFIWWCHCYLLLCMCENNSSSWDTESTPSSEFSLDSSGNQTIRLEELKSSLGSTSSGNDQPVTEDAIPDTSMCPSLEPSTYSDQYHSLDSQNGTMVLGSLKEPLSESTLPSLERQSRTISPFIDISTSKVSQWSNCICGSFRYMYLSQILITWLHSNYKGGPDRYMYG